MRRYVGLAALGAIVVTALFFFFLLRPKLSDIAETRDQIAAAQDEQQQLRNQIARLEDARRQAPEIARRLERLSALLPSDPDLPGFIRALQRAATASGVDLRSIAPARPSEVQGAVGIRSVNTGITVIGSFRRMQEFLSRLENLRRVVEVHSITLNTMSDPDTAQTVLTANLSMVMYVVEPEARTGAAAPPPAPAPTEGASP